MTQLATFESYFQTRLAAAASRDAVAAPATFETLADSLASYLSEAQVRRVQRAYEFARAAHEGQMRRTGHKYITHPLAVAQILAEMRMDHRSVAAALLHDVLEDTGATKRKLESVFGKEVAQIVDGVSKLATIFKTNEQAQAENFQKMAMATASDLRVILVKLADRLHNMRTLGVMPLENAAASRARPSTSTRPSPIVSACTTCASSWRNSASSLSTPCAPTGCAARLPRPAATARR